ncbi:hypothetical protein EK904_002900 [Melospiza melodia maxima]|nr:hypothetical protein EK904_002900 [Melospiza melodia maxima]
MMAEQPPPLEATPLLNEVPLLPHMVNGDSIQQASQPSTGSTGSNWDGGSTKTSSESWARISQKGVFPQRMSKIQKAPNPSFVFCFLQVILVQVNPGETFTITTEDGHIQCIQGKGSLKC